MNKLLSSFLKSGFTLANFKRSGKIPVINIWLTIIEIGNAIKFFMFFSSFSEVESGPELVLQGNLSIILDIMFSSTSWKWNEQSGFSIKKFVKVLRQPPPQVPQAIHIIVWSIRFSYNMVMFWYHIHDTNIYSLNILISEHVVICTYMYICFVNLSFVIFFLYIQIYSTSENSCP